MKELNANVNALQCTSLTLKSLSAPGAISAVAELLVLCLDLPCMRRAVVLTSDYQDSIIASFSEPGAHICLTYSFFLKRFDVIIT